MREFICETGAYVNKTTVVEVLAETVLEVVKLDTLLTDEDEEAVVLELDDVALNNADYFMSIPRVRLINGMLLTLRC